MANKPLTKEQKLEILSQAIDAGGHIDISFHTNTYSHAPVDELKKIFAGMKVDPSATNYKQSRWIQFSDVDDLVFRGVIFLPNEEPVNPEWKDTGDMEEANV